MKTAPPKKRKSAGNLFIDFLQKSTSAKEKGNPKIPPIELSIKTFWHSSHQAIPALSVNSFLTAFADWKFEMISSRHLLN